ncbi:uncharacterized protein L201_004072 [Kwoniella dendrophila CBS 6074]|uniref:Small ribosomal subunit protein uS13m n=1 Tax=Kwoniella dendrophila CBS 6074 TaxID=1295534 RepID=A0AAX4JWJ3_9TREE
MHLLGHNLPDHKPLKIALLTFYGISHPIALRLLARLSIHSEALVSDLTEPQLTSLSAYLSSPSTTLKSKDVTIKLSPPTNTNTNSSSSSSSSLLPKGNQTIFSLGLGNSNKGKSKATSTEKEDPLDELKLETEARRSMQADIAHLRMVGTYRGKRHAAGYPVRGQRTQTNASTAKKHNRVERRGFASSAISPSFGTTEIPSPPSRILKELSLI